MQKTQFKTQQEIYTHFRDMENIQEKSARSQRDVAIKAIDDTYCEFSIKNKKLFDDAIQRETKKFQLEKYGEVVG